MTIYLEKVTKKYRSGWTLGPLDLEIEEGEIFGFLGPNGAGKTTTGKLLAGLIRPSSGIVRIFGENPVDNSAVKQKIGYVTEDNILYFYYLWSQWAGKNLPQAGGVLAIILGMGAVANEYKRKTALFLLARPVSRARILGNKFAAAIISLAVVIFVSTLVMLAAARLAGYHFTWGTQLATAVPSFAGAVLIFAVTAFFSSFSPGALPAALGGLGATVLSVLTPYFFKSNALNILFHMAGVRFFQEGVFPWPFILASFILAAVFYFLALLVFSRREAL